MDTFGTTNEMRAFCRVQHRACTGGSDEHQNREIDTFMRVGVRVADLSAPELLAELSLNRHQVVRILRPGPLHVPFAWRLIDDPARVVNHLLTMSRNETAAWLAWTVIAATWMRRRRRSTVSPAL